MLGAGPLRATVTSLRLGSKGNCQVLRTPLEWSVDNRWTLDDCTASSTHFRTCSGGKEMQRMQESRVIYIMEYAALFPTLQIRGLIRMQAGVFRKKPKRVKGSHRVLFIFFHKKTHSVFLTDAHKVVYKVAPLTCKAFIRTFLTFLYAAESNNHSLINSPSENAEIKDTYLVDLFLV